MKRQHYDVSPTANTGRLKTTSGASRDGSDGRRNLELEDPHLHYAQMEPPMYPMHGAEGSYAPQQPGHGAYIPFAASHPYPNPNYAEFRPVSFSGPLHSVPRGSHGSYEIHDRRDPPQTMQQYPRKSHRPMSPQVAPPHYAQHTARAPGSAPPYYANPSLPVQMPMINPLPVQFPYPRNWSQWPEYRPFGEEKDEDEEKVVTTGHWSRKEEAILLTLVQSMVNYELKVIAQAAWDCNIHRNSRAVDKKLKRLIHYQTWKDRSKDEVLRTIEKTLAESTYKLTDAESSLVKDVIEKYTQK